MDFVWIDPEKCWGEVVKRYPLYSIVTYFKDGMLYEELFENEDLTDLSEMGIDYESDEI